MTASSRMAGLVEAYGQAVHETAQPDSTQADGRVHDDDRTALLAAIGELERARDAQAERLAAFESCDRARQAAEEEVAALKAEVERLTFRSEARGVDTAPVEPAKGAPAPSDVARLAGPLPGADQAIGATITGGGK